MIWPFLQVVPAATGRQTVLPLTLTPNCVPSEEQVMPLLEEPLDEPPDTAPEGE